MNNLHLTFPLDLLSKGSPRTPFSNSQAADLVKRIAEVFRRKGVGYCTCICLTLKSPAVLRFEFTPDESAKLRQIRSCEDDLNEALKDYGPVRLIAPVPGKGTIAVEVPRPDRQIVRLREVLESKQFQEAKAHLPVALGVDSENNTVVADLAKMPHLLIAGSPGQGKSVLLNSIILSLISRLSPDDLKLVLIDTKMVEFSSYDKIKTQYLLGSANESPEVITSFEKVPTILNSIAREVEIRYELLMKALCRSIWEYNQRLADGELLPVDNYPHMSHIVVVIDEFADLKANLEKAFENPLARIAVKSRAVGIHLIIATQCPKADFIVGMIKANFPARIAFKVCSEIESKTILDIAGSEKLIGMGDMLVNYNGLIERIQGSFVDTHEIESICDWIGHNVIDTNAYVLPSVEIEIHSPRRSYDQDPLFQEVAQYVVESNRAFTSDIQQRFAIGYVRAGRLMDQLEAAGIVGPLNAGKPREVLICDNKKSSVEFKHLLELLSSDDKDDETEINLTEDMKEPSDKKGDMSFAELLDLLEVDNTPFRFPYEDYKIIGDITEIEKIYQANGYINIDVGDILNTLSKETVNYVSTGSGDGYEFIGQALDNALTNLPIPVDNISEILFNIWAPRKISIKDLEPMRAVLNTLSVDIDVFWGITIDDSLDPYHANVSLIAVSK
ncbi:MAG: hypothetical protein K2J42_01000 [Muribaculaceae bacterium]|nr:hypothetical protein [Muribaculaceae bacterium]